MSAILQPEISPDFPRRRPWTRQEYERAAQMGLFGPEERLELIAGEIIEKMPQNEPHATGIQLLDAALRPVFGPDHCFRIQMPLALSAISMPEPDFAVVTGSIRDYARHHPETALLVVEVSDTTLAYDRSIKVKLYAEAGIPEFWILNLIERSLEVYREPGESDDGVANYRSKGVYLLGESVSPLLRPNQSVLIGDLLP